MPRGWTKEKYEEEGSPHINPHKALEFSSDFARIASNLVACGANYSDIAFVLGTTEGNLKKWKKEQPEFQEALERGKEITLGRLIGAAIKAAEGDSVEETVITGKAIVQSDGTILDLKPGEEVDVRKTIKKLPPNDRLIQFLANTLSRQLGKDDWVTKNLSETKVSGEVVHKIDSEAVKKQIEAQSVGLTKKISCEVIENECS
jgi:predicted transcriptional regulator